jgi:hypothetical protein
VIRVSQPGNTRPPKADQRADDPRWRVDPGKRPGLVVNRYRGKGHRGRMSRQETDGQDLNLAQRTLREATEALLNAHGIADDHERREATASAVGQLAWVMRAIDEVVQRRTPKRRTRIEQDVFP